MVAKRDTWSFPYVRGISRVADNDRVLLISLDEVPSDDAMRDIHECLKLYSKEPNRERP